MKVELETQDIEAIAQRVSELLKPILSTNHDPNDRWFNVRQLSEYIGISAQWIYNNKNKLPHVNINSKPLFRKSEVDRWLESYRVKTGNEIIEFLALNGNNRNNEIRIKGFNHQKR